MTLKVFICAQFFLSLWAVKYDVQHTGIKDVELPLISRSSNHQVDKLSVYVFLGTDCPISQDYVGILNDLSSRYEGKVSFTGVVPNPRNAKEVNDFRREYEVAFSLVSDKDLALVKRFKAHVTPEAVLLDAAERVQYQGAVDNWYYALGKHRKVPTEHYLADAIEALLHGNAVTTTATEPVGCIIATNSHH